MGGVLGLLVAAIFFGTRSARDSSAKDDDRPADGGQDEPVRDEPEAQEAFAQASDRLESAGSFAYRGTVQIVGSTGAATVDGEVVLPDRMHEITEVPSGEVQETVVDGALVWRRTAPSRGGLLAAEFETFEAGDPGVAAAALPDVLGQARDHHRLGVDQLGRAVYGATLTAEAMGKIRPGQSAAGGRILVILDGAGDPVRVEVADTPESPGAVALRIARVGEPMTIKKGRELGDWLTATPSEAVAAGIRDPVALTRAPRGWVLDETELSVDSGRPPCATLTLIYGDADAMGDTYLRLYLRSPDCGALRVRSGDPITAGSFEGTAARDDTETRANVSDGNIEVAVETSLSAEQVEILLASLGPFDPRTRLTALD